MGLVGVEDEGLVEVEQDAEDVAEDEERDYAEERVRLACFYVHLGFDLTVGGCREKNSIEFN